jgi:hypothetical protein
MTMVANPELPSGLRVLTVSASLQFSARLRRTFGRPSKADFVKVYGPKGPSMTWAQRAKAGVDAKHFQKALKAKS